MHRSATSVISLSIDTGRSMRTSVSFFSIASRNSRRLSSGIVDSADPAGEALEADAREPGGEQPLRERLRLRERQHRVWQVGISIPMFRHEPADGRQNFSEVEEIDR